MEIEGARSIKTYHSRDKSDYPEGPWMDEPDKIQFVDEATGFPCLIVRNHVGSLCGYVGVRPDHPLHGVHYQDDRADGLSVHGGVTFTDFCDEDAEEDSGICHVPECGDIDRIWWFGFDCAHASDACPLMHSTQGKMLGIYNIFDSIVSGARGRSNRESYKDIAFVVSEIQSLASQLADVR